jgi:anti-sigma-K factor RskA
MRPTGRFGRFWRSAFVALSDIIVIAGGALVAFGAWEAYAPAGPIVAGILVIGVSLLSAAGATL